MPTTIDLPVSANGAKLRSMVGAVIYIRVSTKEQTENLSLPTQLRACEEYCHREGFEVVQRFKEEGESAKTADRTELQRLLAYCRTNKGKVHFVVVFNLTRFALDKYDHFALHSHLRSLGISLRSATEPIDDTSTGKLMEGVLAAFAQFDNDVRSDRTRAEMRAALDLGRWTFLAPLGYMNAPRATGKSLFADPDRGPIVRRVFKEYATGRFTKQQMLQQATRWGLTNRRGQPLSSQAIGMLLRNRLYVGVIDVPDFGVRDKRGDFEPLISDEVFYKAQAVLAGRVPVTAPLQRNRPDFPLRGFVLCAGCRKPYTAAWSRGKKKEFAYYRCNSLGCEFRHKGVRADRMHVEFEALLGKLKPRPAILEGVRTEFLEEWKRRQLDVETVRKERQRKLDEIQKQIDGYLDAVGRCHSPTMLKKIEEEVEALDAKRLRLGGRIGRAKPYDFEHALALVIDFLQDPSQRWRTGDLSLKRLVLRLVFSETLVYDRETGFGTPTFSLPINMACVLELDKMELVDMVRRSWNTLAQVIREWGESLSGHAAAANSTPTL